jgi:hypothetical protein
VIDTISVEKGRTALYTMHDIAFFEQEFCEVGAILAGDAGDQRDLGLLGTWRCGFTHVSSF